ncbi:MAG: hypothetical protein HQL52_15950 [Magnetococcales bacterium]|nr:hypothetical protein [Magnetococcales bacterium]
MLVVFLTLLLFLSILALSAMDSGVTEQKMAGNSQFQVKAFNDAEALLVQGEDYIENTIAVTFPTFQRDADGIEFTESSFSPPGIDNVTIEHLQGNVVVDVTLPYEGALPNCAEDGTGCLDYYRVTATGEGVGPSRQIVESLFANYIDYVP